MIGSFAFLLVKKAANSNTLSVSCRDTPDHGKRYDVIYSNAKYTGKVYGQSIRAKYMAKVYGNVSETFEFFDGNGTSMDKIKSKYVLLLMSDVDAQFFERQLAPHVSDTAFLPVTSVADIEAALKYTEISMRLIAFCTGVVVPRHVIEQLNYNCFNFHPGPPERPGYMPAPFAIRDKARDYGVTFHFMLPMVDTGKIIEVSRFALKENQGQEEIEIAAYTALLQMVVRQAQNLADVNFQFEPCKIDWSGVKTTRKDLAELNL